MEECLNRGWGPSSRVAFALRATANRRWAHGIGVSTPCGAVSAQENSIFVPEVWELVEIQKDA